MFSFRNVVAAGVSLLIHLGNQPKQFKKLLVLPLPLPRPPLLPLITRYKHTGGDKLLDTGLWCLLTLPNTLFGCEMIFSPGKVFFIRLQSFLPVSPIFFMSSCQQCILIKNPPTVSSIQVKAAYSLVGILN